MYKYRRLTIEELNILEDQFIRFLAAQSISGEDWKKFQEEDKEKTEAYIDQFSDVVIEKTLHNVNILEQRTTHRIVFYEFMEEEATLYGIEFQGEIAIDFSGEFNWKDMVLLLNKPEIKASYLNGSKKYTKDRLVEIFDVLQQGSRIVSDREIFNSMLKLFEE